MGSPRCTLGDLLTGKGEGLQMAAGGGQFARSAQPGPHMTAPTGQGPAWIGDRPAAITVSVGDARLARWCR